VSTELQDALWKVAVDIGEVILRFSVKSDEVEGAMTVERFKYLPPSEAVARANVLASAVTKFGRTRERPIYVIFTLQKVYYNVAIPLCVEGASKELPSATRRLGEVSHDI
jgi:hypothetical protein